MIYLLLIFLILIAITVSLNLEDKIYKTNKKNVIDPDKIKIVNGIPMGKKNVKKM